MEALVEVWVQPMSRRESQRGESFCGWCPQGLHVLCPGDCACNTQVHQPDEPLARRMAVYLRPDIDGGVDQDQLVASIRRTT